MNETNRIFNAGSCNNKGSIVHGKHAEETGKGESGEMCEEEENRTGGKTEDGTEEGKVVERIKERRGERVNGKG